MAHCATLVFFSQTPPRWAQQEVNRQPATTKSRPSALTAVWTAGKVTAASQSTVTAVKAVEVNVTRKFVINDTSILKALFISKSVFLFFLFKPLLRRGAPFAGYSLGKFRVRWSRFDAVIGHGYDEFDKPTLHNCVLLYILLYRGSYIIPNELG